MPPLIVSRADARWLRLVLVAAGLLLGVLAGEIFFRVVPFERVKYEIRYGHFSGNQVRRFLEYDPDLTFRNRRGTSFPDAGVSINAFGLRGPEIAIAKKPGVRRILCLGDSCTFGALHPYPELLQSALDERAPGAFEVLNAGVIGYTSVHGLRWLEQDLLALEPDVVTVYFGWNDMWREKDSAIRDWFRARVSGEPRPKFHSYFLEAVSRAKVFIENSLGRTSPQVPLPQYRQVLARFSVLGREHHFLPIYLTAPAGFDDDHTPAWLVEQGFLTRDDSAPALRRAYNEALVEVARQRHRPFVDLAKEIESWGGRRLFDDPDRDPIHPNDAGYRRIAVVLADEIVRLVGVTTTASTTASASR